MGVPGTRRYGFPFARNIPLIEAKTDGMLRGAREILRRRVPEFGIV
jgi:hypothetical protein